MIRLIDKISRSFVVILAGAMVLMATGGTWFYQTQKQALRLQAEATLQTIANLKVDALVQWRSERLSDSNLLAKSPFLGRAVEEWLKNPLPALTEQLLNEFRSLRDHARYSDVLLVDPQGQIRLSLAGRTGQIDAFELRTLNTAWRETGPQFSDLHQDADDPFPHATGISPIFGVQGSAGPVGAILLRTDARQFLYPLLQTWPIPTESGESLLVEPEGNSVLYLNNLRFQPDSALNLRIPATQTEVPAVMAAQGRRGLIYGTDYRGVKVMSVVAAIANTSWFLEIKIDMEEALAGWRQHSSLLLALFLVLVAMVATAAGTLIWRRIAQSYHRDLFQTEKALRESEQEFRSLAESMPQIVWATRPDGWNIYFNRQWVDYTGLTLEESHGHGWNKPFHPDDQQRACEAWQQATKNIGTYSIECRLRRADGLYRWWLVRGVPVCDEGGAVTQWYGTCTDIEDIKQAEVALTESQKHLHLIFSSAANGLLVANAEGRIVLSNPSLASLFGYTPDELFGQPVEILVPIAKRDRHVEERREFFAGGDSHRVQRVKRVLYARHREGHEIPIELTLNRFDSGEERFVLAMVIDIR
ncbi:hypothetical protein CCP4SC76_8040001 [Gammaproteobacteria bacterium]